MAQQLTLLQFYILDLAIFASFTVFFSFHCASNNSIWLYFNQFDFSGAGKYSVCGACVSVGAGLCVIRGSINRQSRYLIHYVFGSHETSVTCRPSFPKRKQNNLQTHTHLYFQ